MSAHANVPLASLDWQRIVALGTSFSLHVLAVAIVAIPIAMPLPRLLPKAAEVRIFEPKPPPPALPIPPEPLPLVHPRPSHHPVAALPVPQAPIAPTPSPLESPIATTPIASAPVDSAPGDAHASPAGGETRMLAYDGALKLTYPPTSMRQREQGTVWLRVLVDTAGVAQRIEIERSSGHPRLDIAAREAVRNAHFRPVLRDGRAVPAWGIVPIEFRLERS